ncbi:UDP-N-acetylmuramoyl-L-alanine--D-glutamate ligase, partial [Candidatus Uhrbacteria bacterium]|nr:UDP-N-acetylmuramoyl-L-alanine--D-glutamate ligase [Candidatus Uhrbacteria bacterium]
TDFKTKKELQSSITRLQLTTYNLQLHLGKHRKEDFIDTDMVVRNPAVPVESPFLKIAKKHGVPIENEATLFFKYCKSKNIIGVTGTRGKSTTSAMIVAILKERIKNQESRIKNRVWLAGNIRTTPMLSIVDRIQPDDWVVLELSSWHLEDMDRQKISPHIAVVTNVLQDHLNRYTGMRSYARAKETIVRYQKRGDIVVLNWKNIITRRMAKHTQARVHWFNRENFQFPISNFQLQGQHNFMNAQAAAVVARAIGIPLRIVRSAFRTFRGLPDRLEYIRTVRGVRYYNDTTATTPDATIAALRALSRAESRIKNNELRIILIAGGSDKELDYKPLVPWIQKTCKAVVLLPGTATDKIKKFLILDSLFVIRSSTMHDAVKISASLATRGDTVLLSPAAASFGLFQHEFDRGDQFRKAVRKIYD